MNQDARNRPAWVAAAFGRIDQTISSAPDSLSERLAVVADRMAHMNGATSLPAALSQAVATPFLDLLDALRADYGLDPDEPRLADLGEATLAFYTFVRVQDDLVDEPDLLDRAYVYVAEVFAGTSRRAFADALGADTRFFAFQERVMSGFLGAAVWEVDHLRAGRAAEESLALMGKKFLPMAVPLGAMALLGGHPEHLDALVNFTTGLGGGLQMVNDILNVREDHGAGRLTPVLAWMYERGVIRPGDCAGSVRVALLASDVLDNALRHSQDAIGAAETTARALGAEGLAAVARERLTFTTTVPDRLLSLHLGVPEL